jgi:hypothetical protein
MGTRIRQPAMGQTMMPLNLNRANQMQSGCEIYSDVEGRRPGNSGRCDPRGWSVKRLRSWQRRLMPVAAIVALLAFSGGVQAGTGTLSVELNKLEPEAHGCRAYFVVNNTSGTAYGVLKLDLVLFRPDGVIGRRFAIDLGPLKPDKRTVKLFDIDDTPCTQVGSVLLNDVLECKGESGPIADCLGEITVSSLTKAQLMK